MTPRRLDGPGAVALGALAGGCLEAWVTRRAATDPLAGALATRLPALGGRCRTVHPARYAPTGAEVGLDGAPAGQADWAPEGQADGAPAGQANGAPAGGDGGPPEGPVLWLCAGDELPHLLGRLERRLALEQAYPDATLQAAAADPVQHVPAARLLLVSLAPSPGLAAVLASGAPAWLWCPGSSRMAYRLAAAGCRAAGAGRGPAVLLLDGELPPETVEIPPEQVPGQETPTPRTGPRDGESPAPPLLGAPPGPPPPGRPALSPAARGERGRTPVPGRGDLLAAVAAAPTPASLLPFHHAGPDNPDLLLVGTGTTFGELARACTELGALGHAAAHLHLRQLRPFPVELVAPVWTSARGCLVVEAPGGGLAGFLVQALGLPGLPPVVPNLDLLGAALRRLAAGPAPIAAHPSPWPPSPAPPPPDRHHGPRAGKGSLTAADGGPAAVGGPPSPAAVDPMTQEE